MVGFEKSSRDIFYVLFRHKWKMIVFFCCVMGAVILGTLLTPEGFRSDAKIMVRLGRESVALDPTATTGPLISVAQSRENEVKSEMEILKSRELIEKVVDAIGPSFFLSKQQSGGAKQILPDPLGWIREFFDYLSHSSTLSDRDKVILDFMDHIKIEALKDSNIISISFEARSRKLAQEAIDRLIRFHLDKHINVHRTAGSYDFFAQQTEQFRNSLAQNEENLKELKNRTGIASLDEQRRILLKRIGDLQQEGESTESALAASMAKVQAMTGMLGQLPETLISQETTGNPNQGTDLMRSKFYELQLKEQELLSKYTEQSHPVREIRRQIAEAKALLDKEEPTRTQVMRGLNEAHKQVQLALLAEKTNLSSLRAKARELRSQSVRAQSHLKAINDSEMELAMMEREMALQEANYRKYSEKLEQARIDQALEIGKISNISIVQPPTYPVKPIRPRTTLNIALGILLGILGGIGLAFFLEYVDHSFKISEDIEEKLKLSTLATIPLSEGGFEKEQL
jgi:uncharacterized protein involved in exopolysaccharide biosynthesis